MGRQTAFQNAGIFVQGKLSKSTFPPQSMTATLCTSGATCFNFPDRRAATEAAALVSMTSWNMINKSRTVKTTNLTEFFQLVYKFAGCVTRITKPLK